MGLERREEVVGFHPLDEPVIPRLQLIPGLNPNANRSVRPELKMVCPAHHGFVLAMPLDTAVVEMRKEIQAIVIAAAYAVNRRDILVEIDQIRLVIVPKLFGAQKKVFAVGAVWLRTYLRGYGVDSIIIRPPSLFIPACRSIQTY